MLSVLLQDMKGTHCLAKNGGTSCSDFSSRAEGSPKLLLFSAAPELETVKLPEHRVVLKLISLGSDV